MKFLGVDFETTGDDTKNDHITEVGAMEFEVGTDSEGCYMTQKLDRLQQFVWEPGYPKLSPFIQELTSITDDMLIADGIDPKRMLTQYLFPMMEKADYVVAHNKNFDKTLMESVSARYGLAPPKKTWICSMSEVPYPEKYKCKKLSHLAFDHGVKVEGRKLHRALDDVELMIDLLTSKYDMAKVLDYALSPWVYLRAIIPAPWTDGGAGKAAASKLGYTWERARGTEKPVFEKCWVKRVKASQVAAEKASAPFSVVVLKTPEEN